MVTTIIAVSLALAVFAAMLALRRRERVHGIPPAARRPWSDAMLRDAEAACGLPYRAGKDHINEYSVMLDHAARRISSLHSWLKLVSGPSMPATSGTGSQVLLISSV